MTNNNPNTENSTDLDDDTIFHLLSVKRRRDALKILSQKGPMDQSELATNVASLEQNKEPEQLDCDERNRVLISLHQAHSDPLEDAGVVDIDDGTYSLTPKAEKLLWYIETEPPQSFKERFRDKLNSLF